MKEKIVEKIQFNNNKNKIYKVIEKAWNTQYYKGILKNIGIHDINDIYKLEYENYCQLPIMTKKCLNDNKFQMLENGKFIGFNYDVYREVPYSNKRKYLKSNGLELRVTSGSTGEPIEVLKSKADLQRDYVMLNWYRRKITNYDFKGKFLWIWPVNALIRKYFYSDEEIDKWWIVNKYGVQYMLYEHSDMNFYEIYKYIVENDVEWITSSPTALVNFVDFLVKNQYSIKSVKYIECHSEYLYEWQKEIIKAAFNSEIVSIYSSNEVQFIGGTIQKGVTHVFEKSCFLELEDRKDTSSSVVVTSLNYLDIPVLRYQLGDCAEWVNEEKIIYGFDSPTMELKKYRENDYIVMRNNNRMEPFVITDSVVILGNELDIEIKKYKVIQEDYDRFVYFFDGIALCYIEKCRKILSEYLSALLRQDVIIDIRIVSFKELTYLGKKYKYFELGDKLK